MQTLDVPKHTKAVANRYGNCHMLKSLKLRWAVSYEPKTGTLQAGPYGYAVKVVTYEFGCLYNIIVNKAGDTWPANTSWKYISQWLAIYL
jgi:hypothetical protein